MRYWAFVVITALAVFFVGWRLSSGMLMLLSFFFFGEGQGPFWRIRDAFDSATPYFGLAVGAAWAVVLIRRAARTRIANKYLHFQFWPSAVFVIWVSVVWVNQLMRDYRGPDPESAGRAIVQELYGNQVAQEVILTEETKEEWPSWVRGPTIVFLASDASGEVCRVRVCARYGWWWEYAGHEIIRPTMPDD
jgi:hypothetical protein